MMPLRYYFADKSRRVNFNFKERLEEGRHRRIKEWTDVTFLRIYESKDVKPLAKNA